MRRYGREWRVARASIFRELGLDPAIAAGPRARPVRGQPAQLVPAAASQAEFMLGSFYAAALAAARAFLDRAAAQDLRATAPST